MAAPVKTEPGWIKAFVTNEPLLVSSLIAAVGVFTTVRWSASKVDLTNQLIAGLLPILLGFTARAYVTPVAKTQSPDQLATYRDQLTQLQTQADLVLPEKVRQLFDSLLAQVYGAISPGDGLPAGAPVGTSGALPVTPQVPGSLALAPPTLVEVAQAPETPPAGQ